MDDAEVEPVVSAGRLAPLLVLAVLVIGGLGATGAAPAARAAAAYPRITASIHGPTLVGTGSNDTYYLNATGGPAFGENGTEIGSISWKVKTSAAVSTGISVSPNSSTFSGSKPGVTHLKVGAIAESITLAVTVNSTGGGVSKTKVVNLTVQAVVPYVVRAQLVAGAKAGVLPFAVTVLLDGTKVGTAQVPAIAAGATYNLTYDYATAGLSPGEHTFTISLAGVHGVTFAGGATEYSQSFYVVGPPPDYLLYVVLGGAVLVGVLLIFATRVGARRRASAKK